MKITKGQLRQIIREERKKLIEASNERGTWHPDISKTKQHYVAHYVDQDGESTILAAGSHLPTLKKHIRDTLRSQLMGGDAMGAKDFKREFLDNVQYSKIPHIG